MFKPRDLLLESVSGLVTLSICWLPGGTLFLSEGAEFLYSERTDSEREDSDHLVNYYQLKYKYNIILIISRLFSILATFLAVTSDITLDYLLGYAGVESLLI